MDRTREFAKQLSWTLHVPGTHSGGGPTYNALLGYLAEQDRDFTADTKSLRAHVRLKLQLRFESRVAKVPTVAEMRVVAADAILEWVLGRMDRKVRDQFIRANDVEYGHWKRRVGLDTRPGQATGELRAAIKDRGRVKVT